MLDFRELFESLSAPMMVLDRDLRYVAMNDVYLAATRSRREDLMGAYIFDAFPESGERRERLEASLTRARDEGVVDVLALITYNVPRRPERGGGYEERIWSATHSPLHGSDGRIKYILQHTEDVTELQRLKETAFALPQREAAAVLGDAVLARAEQVQRAYEALADDHASFLRMFMQAPSFMAMLEGPEHRFTFVNNAYAELVGAGRAVVGLPVAEALPDLEGQGFFELLDRVRNSRAPFIGKAIRVTLQRTAGEEPEDRFLDFIYQPVLNADGEPLGVFVEGTDVTEQVRAREQQQLLIDELNHRVKNTLATVQSIAVQTRRRHADPEQFQPLFEARLQALAKTQSLLTQTQWRGADMADLLTAELAPFGQERVALDGPSVWLRPHQATALGLIFHELAVNAAKHGALSDGGRVRVSWRVSAGEPDAVVSLEWTESGGPETEAPSELGFGSRLLERSVRAELQGEVAVAFPPEGFSARLRWPLAS